MSALASIQPPVVTSARAKATGQDKSCSDQVTLILTYTLPQDAVLLLRHLSLQKRKSNSLRDHRPHILAEAVELIGDEATATVKVSGFVRGGNGLDLLPRLSVNRLVHIPGWGSFQLEQV